MYRTCVFRIVQSSDTRRKRVTHNNIRYLLPRFRTIRQDLIPILLLRFTMHCIDAEIKPTAILSIIYTYGRHPPAKTIEIHKSTVTRARNVSENNIRPCWSFNFFFFSSYSFLFTSIFCKFVRLNTFPCRHILYYNDDIKWHRTLLLLLLLLHGYNWVFVGGCDRVWGMYPLSKTHVFFFLYHFASRGNIYGRTIINNKKNV